MAYSDPDIYQMAWDDFKDQISELMDEMGDGSFWYAAGENLGWQHMSGEKYFQADNGEELLKAILPKTDVTIHVYWERPRKELRFRVSHHDAPMGETYYVRPATEKENNSGVYE